MKKLRLTCRNITGNFDGREKHFARIKKMLKNEISPVHVIIKGTPDATECGVPQC
jgi:hypothetical protein